MTDSAPLVRAAEFVRDAVDGRSNAATDLDWGLVFWLARRQHVVARVAAAVVDRVDSCPDWAREGAEALRSTVAMKQLARLAEIAQVQAAFRRHGVSALFMGSAAFAAAGHDRVELRDPEDTTLVLVEEQQKALASEVMVSAGYRVDQPVADRVVTPGRSTFNLRSAAPWMRRLLRPDDERRVVAEWLSRARSVSISGEDVFTLSRGDWLLHECGASGRGLSRLDLRRARDVVALGTAADHDDRHNFFASIASARARTRFIAALRASFEVLKRSMPPELSEGLRTVSPNRLGLLIAARVAALAQGAWPPGPDPNTSAIVLGAYAPTPRECVDRMLSLAGVRSDDVVFDLGSGDGRVVLAAARDYGARAIGVEADTRLVAQARTAAAQVPLASFVEGDAASADVRDATVVCFYVTPAAVAPLLSKLMRELRAGARIVSHNGLASNIPPDKTAIVRSGLLECSFISVWIVPQRAAPQAPAGISAG